MGSEQSSQVDASGRGAISKSAPLRRGKSVPNRESISSAADTPPRCISPGPSICSDSDLPYISYTVNRPIGDSPKMTNKQLQQQQSQLLRGKSLGSVEAKRKFGQKKNNDKIHDIVVVKAATSDPTTDKDPDLVKLKNIPMFLPIMRGTLNLPPRVRDPEVLERLDPLGLFNLCARYQHHLNNCAQTVATEQNALCTNIDTELNKIIAVAADRQRKFAKFADQLGRVHDLSRQLNKCHMQLNQTLESLETLNNLLPIEERLEPFVWTTG